MEGSKLKGNCSSLPSLLRDSSKRAHNLQLGYKRRDRVIVAASPPTEDAVVATEPLTKEDLVAYLASGCKSKEKWRFNFL